MKLLLLVWLVYALLGGCERSARINLYKPLLPYS